VSARARILLVEDSELVCDALGTLFEAMGHEVRLSHTAQGAVVACEAEVPDIMLLDLSLADGEGLPVVEAVRARGVLPRVVAAMTGDDDPATRRRCLAAGCRDVLVKPVGARELLSRIGTWMAEGDDAPPASPPSPAAGR
jgi:DNA-binding response OmpR family regulator